LLSIVLKEVEESWKVGKMEEVLRFERERGEMLGEELS